MVQLLSNFTRLCKTTDNGEEVCSCDFRINIYDCQNNEFYVIAGKILVVICILSVMIATGLLIYLIKIKKQPFFLSASGERGWIRPRPLHSYHLIVISYLSLEAFHLIALITELYPSITAAELGNVTMNVVTSSVAIFYTISIVYSTPNVKFNESFEMLCNQKGLNGLHVDIIGVTLFILPIVSWYPLAYLTGHYAERNDIETANLYYTAHYLAFVVWEVAYVAVLLFFWYNLMSIIKSYIKMVEQRNLSSGSTISSDQIGSIRKSARNITIPVMGLSGGLLTQAIIFIVMSLTYRNITIYSFGWNLFYYWIEYLSFPLLGFSIESILLYYTITNYNVKTPPSSANNSNNSQNQKPISDTGYH